MPNDGYTVDYPNENVRELLEKTIKDIGFEDYNIKLNLGSSKGDNYLGVIHRAVVEGLKDGYRTKMSFIIKSSPTYNRSNLCVDVFYKKELYCYQEALPALMSFQEDYKIPETERFSCVKIFTGDLKNDEELLIMEDLVESGYTMYNRQEFLTIDHVKLVIKALARLHSLSFKLKQSNPDMYKTISKSIYQGVEVTDYFRSIIRAVMDLAINNILDEFHKDKLVEFRKIAVQKLNEYAMPDLAGEYGVLCHGDCWTSNMMFKYEGQEPISVRLIDWQMIKCTSPIFDIAYHLFSNTDEHLRRAHYGQILDLYYETLSSHLAKMDCDVNVCYPRFIYEKHIEIFMPLGLIMGCFISSFSMAEKDEVQDINSFFEKEVKKVEIKSEKTQKKYEIRIRGIVKDVVDFKII